ncbi:DUF3800 domain-containing protein [Rhizobium lentis]|uniref:DUF3800 domain-containing protein n=1 Tax=Rhizobium lentis TaxID=1138194 RepID=UPI0035C91A76
MADRAGGDLVSALTSQLAEVPLFLDSKASRLIQMTDLIGYWIFRHFQSGDQRGYDLIRPYFARYGVGPVSGLRCHVTPETEARLASLPVPAHPFPKATPKAIAAASQVSTPEDSSDF